MRRDPEHFGEQELNLIYVARKLAHAERLEAQLTGAGIDYAVEPDRYWTGLLFRRERIGAFFYVEPAAEAPARDVVKRAGFEPYEPEER